MLCQVVEPTRLAWKIPIKEHYGPQHRGGFVLASVSTFKEDLLDVYSWHPTEHEAYQAFSRQHQPPLHIYAVADVCIILPDGKQHWIKNEELAKAIITSGFPDAIKVESEHGSRVLHRVEPDWTDADEWVGGGHAIG